MSFDFDLYNNALPVPQLVAALGLSINGNNTILCPAHDEKIPSCTVYTDHVHCYSCGFHQDSIGLVQHVLGCGFLGAIDWIANQAGIDKPHRDPEAQKRYEAAQSISETYSAIFHDSLKNPERALVYLEKKRGISSETTRALVGYLPSDYKPPDVEAAKRAGCYSTKDNFLFAGRLIIPILQYGQIVSLYGRALNRERKPPHIYPASTDPPMPATLWNMDSCRNQKEIFLVEGIVDGLTLIDRGHDNTTALFGTQGLTDARLEALKRTQIGKVTLCLDSDLNGSGQQAALKTGEKLFRAGYEVEIISLPLEDGLGKTDPNTYFQDHTADDFRELPRNDFFQALCEQIPKTGTIQEKAKVARPIIQLVASLNDELLDKGLLKQIRERCPDFTLEALEKRLRDQRRTRPDMLPVGSDFLPDLYADAILSNNHVIHYHGAFFVWKNGVYCEWYDLEVKGVIQQLGRGLLRKAQIEDALHSLMVKTYVRPKVVNRPGIINLLNGHIDLMAESPELLPHIPALLSTIQLPIEYNEDADCPEFTRFLQEKIPDPLLQSLVQEIVGYLLVPDTSYQVGFILLGDTGSGKSTLIHVIRELVGSQNHTAIALEKLGERFESVRLDGKLVNLSPESSVNTYLSDGIIKAIIAGDEISGEKKHVQSYDFVPYCRLVSACNKLPLSHDTHGAFFRRWIVLPFNQKLEPAKFDRTLPNRICKNELSGVLLWALAGLARLRANNAFTVSQAAKEELEQWQRDLDPVREFAHRYIKADGESKILLKTLLKSYNDWIKQTNRQAYFSDSNLKQHLEGAGFVFKHTNKGDAILGYWLAYNPDRESDQSD